MSSSNTNRETEILEQQRRVAARFAPQQQQQQQQPNTTTTTTTTTTRRSLQQRPTMVRKRPTAFVKRNTTSTTTTTLARKKSQQQQQQQPKTAADALAQARHRLAQQQEPHAHGEKDDEKEAATNPETTIASTNTKTRSTGTLSQWISTDDLTSAMPLSSSSSTFRYKAVEPEDFWRNLRDWDLLTAIVQEQTREEPDPAQNHPQLSHHDDDSDDDETTSKRLSPPQSQRPLPDTFVSHRHYMAAWAPLCLAELRAQLLQEVISYKLSAKRSGPGRTAAGGDWKRVLALPSLGRPSSHHHDHVQQQQHQSTLLDYITVVVRPRDRQDKQGNRLQVFPHDLFLLVKERQFATVERTLQQSPLGASSDTAAAAAVTSLRKCGLIGHAEQSRSSLDGLQLKVSKRWWAVIHESSDEAMRLLPLGSNVTAWREFTALCRVESIPLRRHLLGQHLSSSSLPGDSQAQKSKHSMIRAMGGVDALGKGFTKYAKDKFNTSQLEAISAASSDYGEGGFTLIQGPPGSGKTTTLVAVLNSLHIRQFNKYYEEVRKIASNTKHLGNRKVALNHAVRAKPRLLVCAPSNAAVDNIILKIMEEGFKDGGGGRYNPSMIRVGVGQSAAVKDVALENKVDSILAENLDLARLESSIVGYKTELQRVQSDIARLRRRIHALTNACQWPLSKDWEIRVDEETFEQSGSVYFLNHKEKITTFEVPPPPEPGETQYDASSMPEYRAHTAKIVKLVESYNSITSKLERCTIVQGAVGSNNNDRTMFQVRQQLETHVLDSVHLVMTTLGTAGNRVLESANKFEVVVVDEAAQSVEPATLSALQLGSKHSILVGDPQQLPATIFNVSGRNTKYDRSLFQRLEEAGHKVYMLNTQYRMHPAISHFPREIFYGGNLLDGPNVLHPEYGNPLRRIVLTKVQAFQPFTILDLDSMEERGGTSLANSTEAQLAVHLYTSLRTLTSGLSAQSRVAVITPYAQQANLLRRHFSELLGPQYTKFVEVNTVDGFQGREANIVIFSCVRAAGSHGIGFLSDVRRMNVALTRAKHFLFVIARCRSITVNPYWRQLVEHAGDRNALVPVHMRSDGDGSSMGRESLFPPLSSLKPELGRKRKAGGPPEDGELVRPIDPRKQRL